MKRFGIFLALGAATALTFSTPAVAHTKLVSSSPAANASVTTSPRTITLTFSDRVVPRFSKFELEMPAHRMKIPVSTSVSEDGKRIVGRVRSRLMKGSYTIKWTAAAPDGHRMTGEVAFTVS